MTPCLLTSHYHFQASAYLGPIYICFHCSHCLGQFDFSRWFRCELLANRNFNSSQVRVSSRLGISYFWDIHHSHMCSFNKVWTKWISFTIGSGTFSFPLCLWGVVKVFIGEPTLTSSTPFLFLTRERVLSWAFFWFGPTSSFLVFFFLDFCGAGCATSSSKSLKLQTFSSRSSPPTIV